MHPRHGDRVVGNDQVARVGLAAHPVEQVAEAVNVRIVERRVDLVEDADRRGVRQEQREDQRHCGQRLLAAR